MLVGFFCQLVGIVLDLLPVETPAVLNNIRLLVNLMAELLYNQSSILPKLTLHNNKINKNHLSNTCGSTVSGSNLGDNLKLFRNIFLMKMLCALMIQSVTLEAQITEAHFTL